MNYIRWQGYLRKDGRKGIRNYVAVVYLCKCAHQIAAEIASDFKMHAVQLIGSPGCYPNPDADRILNAICTHPNVGGVLLVSMGCEGIELKKLEEVISQSGRPVHTLAIQSAGGTRMSISKGIEWVEWCRSMISGILKVTMSLDDLIVGTISTANDISSGITANPAVGQAVNQLIAYNGRVIYAETRTLAGLEGILRERVPDKELMKDLLLYIERTQIYSRLQGSSGDSGDFNDQDFTTIAESLMSTFCQTGDAPVAGLISVTEQPGLPGLYLLDVLPDNTFSALIPRLNISAKVVDMIASGCHLILCTTGKGSVIGSAIAPMIKICANPITYFQMNEDIDINAGTILDGEKTPEQVGERIFEGILLVASGIVTCSEGMGHREFM